MTDIFAEDRVEYTDHLTGLYNEIGFLRNAQRMIKRYSDMQFTLVLTNFRGFNIVNQFYGVEAGNEILTQVGEFVHLAYDYNEYSVCGRVGGDKFGILYPTDKFNLKSTLLLAETIRNKNDIMKQYNVHFQFGIYNVVGPDDSIPLGLSKALFAIKGIVKEGIAQHAYYSKEDFINFAGGREILGLLPDAIENDEFKMYLQPQYDWYGNLVSAEALVRWDSHVKGMIYPNDFINVLEKAHRIHEIDYIIWRKAFETVAKWQKTSLKDVSISVNVSPLDVHYYDLHEVFTRLAKEYDVSPKCINIEITESAMVEGKEEFVKLMKDLNAAGFTTEIDDFGSGYSSLNMLKEIPTKVVKIDREFINTTDHSREAKIILNNLSSLIIGLGHQMVAEGVETQEQLDYLKSIGVELFQGYYFSRPIPVEEFEQKYSN